MNIIKNRMFRNGITYTWDHASPEMVAHFQIVLKGDRIVTQTVHVGRDTRSFTVPNIPNLSYSGNVTAVSMCWSELDSLPVPFQGKYYTMPQW